MEKLNLGSGFNKKEGFINVDMSPNIEVDRHLDLSTDPWPWSDNSIDEVVFEYSLEEMGETRSAHFQVFKELYRVCCPGAKVLILSAHPHHNEFVLNPISKWPLSTHFYAMLSVKNNLNQISHGLHYTCLGMELGVNFEIVRHRQLIDPRFEEDLKSGQITESDIENMIQFSNNIVQAFEVELKVIKDIEDS